MLLIDSRIHTSVALQEMVTVTGKVPDWLKHSIRLRKMLEQQQKTLDPSVSVREYIARLREQEYLSDLVDCVDRTRQLFDKKGLPAELVNQLEDVRRSVETSGITEKVQRKIAQLSTDALLAPEITTSDVMPHIREIQWLAEQARSSPLQQILHSQTAADLLDDRLSGLAPRYVLDVRNKEGSESPELVLSDSEAAEGERDSDPDILPGVLLVRDVLGEISDRDALELYHHLAKFPLLGVAHPVGKRILDAAVTLECQEFGDIDLFRGRLRNQQRGPFTEKEMWFPPVQKAVQGRANPPGCSYLYTCDTLNGTIAELKGKPGMVADVIEWRLVKKIRILDLSDMEAPLAQFCQFDGDGEVFRPEYLIPSFLAQCIAWAHIPALRLPSVRHPDSTVYVFVNYDCEWFERLDFHVGLPIGEGE
jgi:hypothetical protein